MLKIGTQTGSLHNHLASRATKGQPKAEVGMGATLLLWTDRHAATIIAVEGDGETPGTIISVQQDHAKRADDRGPFTEDQDYEYTPDPNGRIQHFRLSKVGFWEGVVRNTDTGRWNKRDGDGLAIGYRREYRDPCF